MIYSFLILTELMFGLYGFGQILIVVIYNSDYWMINGALYLIFMSFGFLMMIFTLFFLLFREIKTLYRIKRPVSKQLDAKESDNSKNSNKITERVIKNERFFDKFKIESKSYISYLFSRLKSPITLFGLAVIIFLVILPIFPSMLTPYSYSEAIDFYFDDDWWSPPSPEHPLGQCKFGRDVLVRIIYSLPNSLLMGTFSVLVGLAGGLIIGIILILIKRRFDFPFELALISIFVVPMILTFVSGLSMNIHAVNMIPPRRVFNAFFRLYCFQITILIF